ncbi:hypothetical protein chiPu_0017414 [Chiloscyllium punctatum]|uniref:Uncharacterized protein n=1 Tax=Chiloscyllium punctatum TaxID=137246 RepID=A0A401RFS3_CHIPU|nr:hypothetical protein [Chiloscyllium punctatum]
MRVPLPDGTGTHARVLQEARISRRPGSPEAGLDVIPQPVLDIDWLECRPMRRHLTAAWSVPRLVPAQWVRGCLGGRRVGSSLSGCCDPRDESGWAGGLTEAGKLVLWLTIWHHSETLKE